MPEEEYEVTVSAPQEMQLTPEEKNALKQKFKADIIETLAARGEVINTVELQIVDMQY